MRILKGKYLLSWSFAAVLLAICTPASAEYTWGNRGTKCVETQRVDYARLWGLSPFGPDWIETCKATKASGVSSRSDGKLPSTCVQHADGSVWGEWKYSNHESCRTAAASNLHWDNYGDKCSGTTRVEYARLWGLRPGIDKNWKAICEATASDGVSGEAGATPTRCFDRGGEGVWGEWDIADHPDCGPHFEKPEKAGCFGPNKQVYSARLWGDLDGASWEEACAATEGPDELGTPDRCVKGKANEGIWGEWYSGEACEKPLEWGDLRDNGCVKDMISPDANTGGISVEGYRSYSAVLWNAGGNWLEACKFAPIDKSTPDGARINMPFPTACVAAEADYALSWVTTIVLGAATGPIGGTGKAAIASGAVISAASKGAEDALFYFGDTTLNIWGVFWVPDAACGKAQAIDACPATGDGLTPGTRICTCTAEQASAGEVYGGSGTYSAQSSVCRAAVHAGAISSEGGVVVLKTVHAAGDYSGVTAHGVLAHGWLNRDGTFEFTERREP